MQFILTLTSLQKETYVPFDYPYALSAVIYKKIADADQQYASFLHEKGYAQNEHSRHFKFFTFSNLQGKFKVVKEALQLQGQNLTLILACHMPEFAGNLVQGIFADQQFTLAGRGAKGAFIISQIETLPLLFEEADYNRHKVKLQLLSPLVVGKLNERGHDDYLSPEDADFILLLKHNLAEKIAVAYGQETALAETFNFDIETLNRMKTRLNTIKAGQAAETKVRGYFGFELKMEASGRVIQLALDAGLGAMNGVGFGCVGSLGNF